MSQLKSQRKTMRILFQKTEMKRFVLQVNSQIFWILHCFPTTRGKTLDFSIPFAYRGT